MKIDGVLLAAGLSRRFGRPKQLALWRGAPLVVHIAEVALASRLRTVVVVLGHAAPDVRRALAPLLGNPRLRLVYNAEYEEGQASSIRRGVRALDPDAEAAMFLTCDQPFLTPAFLDALLEAFARHRPLICYPVYGETRGSPVIFAAALFPELMALTGDVGGRILIEKYRARVHEQKIASPTPLVDVDTPDDLLALETEAGSQDALENRGYMGAPQEGSSTLGPAGDTLTDRETGRQSHSDPSERTPQAVSRSAKEASTEVLIVCDGSSRRLPSGRRSAAAVAIVERGSERRILGEYLGEATNQQAEIVAACVGLEAVTEPSRIRLLSDSEYVIRTMQGLYKRRANLPLWARLDRAARSHQIEWVWVSGDAGHPLHEICDRAARLIAREGRVDPQKLATLLERSPRPIF